MLPGRCGQVLLHMWDVAHMETLFIGRERESWEDESKITQTLACIAPRLDTYSPYFQLS